MDFDIIGQVAQGGFGYVLFIGAIGIIVYMYKKNQKDVQDLNDKRIQDLVDFRTSSLATVNTLIVAVGSLQKSVEAMTEVLENMRWQKK